MKEVFGVGATEAFGLWPGQLVLWLHSGSRGLGHQLCDDYLRVLAKDRQALHPPPGPPARGRLAQLDQRVSYLAAMAAAANFALNNRQVLAYLVREVMSQALGPGLVYDVAHNVAKLERHQA